MTYHGESYKRTRELFLNDIVVPLGAWEAKIPGGRNGGIIRINARMLKTADSSTDVDSLEPHVIFRKRLFVIDGT